MLAYVGIRRAEQELMSTRALVQAVVAQAPAKAKMEPAITAFDEFFAAMMPHLERAAQDTDDAHKALMKLTKHPLKIGLKEVYQQQAAKWKKNTKSAPIPRAKIIKPKIPGTS